MAIFSSIIGAIGASTAAAIGTAATVAGTAAGVYGQVRQAQGQRRAQQAQRAAEVVRQNQMENDTRRRQLEMIRQQQIARATALTNTTASGASGEGGSAMGGAEGSISGQFGRGVQAESYQAGIGRSLFGWNEQVRRGNQTAADGGTIASMGQGLVSLGGAFVNNAERIGRIGGRS